MVKISFFLTNSIVALLKRVVNFKAAAPYFILSLITEDIMLHVVFHEKSASKSRFRFLLHICICAYIMIQPVGDGSKLNSSHWSTAGWRIYIYI